MNTENHINDEGYQAIDTNKTSKIDFRLPAKMKDMIVVTAQKQGLRVSQFITNLVENHFEEQAKQERIRIENEKQAQIKAEKEYAEFDKKIKQKRGDFTVDESTPIVQDELQPKGFWTKILVWFFVACGGYFIVKFFQNKITEKERNRYLQHWYSHQNQPFSKFKPTMSDKRSDKFVRQR
ncbi:MAG: hypothetical protein MUF58_07535 [Arcicella sp.]|nr:hypothetical protein [Arcicella sp.]